MRGKVITMCSDKLSPRGLYNCHFVGALGNGNSMQYVILQSLPTNIYTQYVPWKVVKYPPSPPFSKTIYGMTSYMDTS